LSLLLIYRCINLRPSTTSRLKSIGACEIVEITTLLSKSIIIHARRRHQGYCRTTPQRLQIRQDALIARLGELSGNNTGATASTRATRIPTETETVSARTFAIGDRVRIRNPKRTQANRGVISNITASRIMAQAANGTKILRAPHNVFLDDE
jgi:hypothetical protein